MATQITLRGVTQKYLGNENLGQAMRWKTLKGEDNSRELERLLSNTLKCDSLSSLRVMNKAYERLAPGKPTIKVKPLRRRNSVVSGLSF